MANIIAVIWDCDKTLIDGYMQDPIFKNLILIPMNFGKKLIEYLMSIRKNIYELTEIHII